jgi:hypothetical protein
MSNASGAIWDLIKHWVINWCSTNSDLWCFLFQIRLIIVVLFTFHKRSTKWSTFLTQSWALGQNSYSSFFEGVSQSQLETCGILQGCVWNHNAPLAQLGFISDLSHNVFNLLQIWDHWDKRLSPLNPHYVRRLRSLSWLYWYEVLILPLQTYVQC